MPREEDQLVLGRGEVYFDRFSHGTRVGTGERYIGNTPAFQMQRQIERVSRARSYRGRRIEVPGNIISESHTINFTTDNISMDNVATWYGDEGLSTESVNQTGLVYETLVVQQGRYYQLGKSLRPLGARGLLRVKMWIGSTEIFPAANYDVAFDTGRIYILPGAPNVPNGSTVLVEFVCRKQDYSFATSQAEETYGALRFVSKNPYGPRKDLFMPFVRLSPRGSIDLKGDEYQQIMFEVTAMRLGPTFEQVYIDEIRAFPTLPPNAIPGTEWPVTFASQDAEQYTFEYAVGTPPVGNESTMSVDDVGLTLDIPTAALIDEDDETFTVETDAF